MMPFRKLLLLITTVISQIVVLIFVQLILVRHLGANKAADVYFASFTVPLFVSTIINSALQAVWLPRLSALFSSNDDWNTKKSEALGQSLIIGILGYILSVLIIVLVGKIIFLGFDEEQHNQLLIYSIIISAIVIFNSISNVCFSVVRSAGRFLAVEILELMINLVYLAGIFYASVYCGILFLVWLYLFRSILITAVYIMMTGFPKFSIRNTIRNVDEWKLMAPIIFSAPIYKLSTVIEKFWISQGPPGSLSLINFATSGINALVLILDKVFIKPDLPKISILANSNEKKSIRELYKKKIIVIGLIFISALFLFAIFKDFFILLIEFLLKLNDSDSANFFYYIVLMLPLIFFITIGNLIISIFYSYKKTKMVTYIGLISFFMGIIYKSFLFNYYGLYGLLIGMSLTFITSLIICLLILNENFRFRFDAN